MLLQPSLPQAYLGPYQNIRDWDISAKSYIIDVSGSETRICYYWTDSKIKLQPKSTINPF